MDDQNKPISVRLPMGNFIFLHKVLEEIQIQGKQARVVLESMDAISKALDKALESKSKK